MIRKILLADDHVVVRKGLRAILKDEFPAAEIVEAADGVRAVDTARRLQPELAVVDIGMPGLNGLEAIRQISRHSPRTRLLVLSLHSGGDIVQESFESGAAGYLLKECAVDELVAAISDIFAGKRYLSIGLASSVREGIQWGKGKKLTGLLERLTAREREVLGLLAEGNNNAEIAEKLFLSPETVKTHRRNMMKKLEVRNLAGLVKFALDHHLTPRL